MTDNSADIVTPQESRRYDIVLFGVTGFTGRLAARYILSRYGAPKSDANEYNSFTDIPKVSYAFAGRSEKKMAQVRDGLAAEFPDLDVSSIPLLIADANNFKSIYDVTASTKVIATLVGPYIKYGEPVIKACIETKTHYCDITGEFPWVKSMISKYGKKAEESEIKMVSFCGLDSLPSDIGALLLHEKSIAKYQKSCEEVRVRYLDIFQDYSSGTVEAIEAMKTSYDEAEIAKFDDEYYLCDDNAVKQKTDVKPLGRYKYESGVGYVTKFSFEIVDSKVVQWAASKLPQIQKPFSFSLGIGNFKSALTASAFSYFVSFFEYLLDRGITKALLKKFYLYGPGEGPKKLYGVNFNMKLIGITTDDQGNVHQTNGIVSYSEEPGYAGTAKLIVESALLMALDIKSCPPTFGIVPPSVGLGLKIVERLAACGIFMKVYD